jgi:hypothetical protein
MLTIVSAEAARGEHRRVEMRRPVIARKVVSLEQ